MAEIRYNIVFRGRISDGKNLTDVKEKLVALYKGNIAKVEKFFTGRAVIVKTSLDYEAAVKYQAKLSENTGAIFDIEPIDSTVSPTIPTNKDDTALQQPPPTELEYHVTFYGEISIGQNIDNVKRNLTEFFHVPISTIDKMFTNTRRKILKEFVSYQVASEYKNNFECTGAVCRIEVAEQLPKVQLNSVAQDTVNIVSKNIPQIQGKSAIIDVVQRFSDLEENAMVSRSSILSDDTSPVKIIRKTEPKEVLLKNFSCPICNKIYSANAIGGNIIFRCIKCQNQLLVTIQVK